MDAEGIETQPETLDGGKSAERKKTLNERKEGKGFEGEGGAGALHQQRGGGRWAKLHTVEVCKLEESEEKNTMLVGVGSPEKAGTQQREQLQE